MTPPTARRTLPAKIREPFAFLWRCVDKFFADNCSTMAAALSFYTFFSLPALLSLLLIIVGTAMDPAEVQLALLTQAGNLIGRAGAEQVRTILEHARQVDANKPAAALLSVIAVAVGASASFGQLQGALNRIWGVKPDPRRGQIRNFLAKRIFSFGVVIGVSFLLLVSLAFSALLGAVGQRMTRGLGVPEALLQFIDWAISFAALSAVFAGMFRLLPDARIAWKDVWVGAVASALLFVVGKSVIGLYLGGTDPGGAYGAAGSLAVILDLGLLHVDDPALRRRDHPRLGRAIRHRRKAPEGGCRGRRDGAHRPEGLISLPPARRPPPLCFVTYITFRHVRCRPG